MDCKFRACKFNNDGHCTKYPEPDDMLEDFKNGGGCAFTWFFSGQIPSKGVKK